MKMMNVLLVAVALNTWSNENNVYAGAKSTIDNMTRKEIVDNAKSVHGYGYWWGKGRWKKSATTNDKLAQCDGPASSCPNCSFAIRPGTTDCIVSGTGNKGKCSSNAQCTQTNYTCQMGMCVHNDCTLCRVKTQANASTCSNNSQCPTDYNCVNSLCTHTDCFGADCSGMAAKSWELGTETIDVMDHPYSTRNFYWAKANKWKRIAWGRVRQGDAAVYLKWNAKKRCKTSASCGSCPSGQSCRLVGDSDYKCVKDSPVCNSNANCTTSETCINGWWTGGHIVIIDKVRSLSRRRFDVWHCAGCSVGVPGCKYQKNWHASNTKYVAIRREKITEEPPCSPNDCSGHGYKQGWDKDYACVCDQGYAGSLCNQCASDYIGYPDCTKDGGLACLNPTEIKCGQELTGNNLTGGVSILPFYDGCNNWVEEANEVVYRFQPKGSGVAKTLLTHVEQGKDVDIFVMLGSCDGLSCFYYSDFGGESQAGFDYDSGFTYFISVDSSTSGAGEFKLKLDCSEGTGTKKIGDPCKIDADCKFSYSGHNQGLCYKHGGSSFCSLVCSGTCPGDPTFCVEDPDNSSRGICTSMALGKENHCCRDVSSTVPALKDRKGGKEAESYVCYPE